jgi:hypothetical protein
LARQRLPHAKNWRERKIEDWNATTFYEYLKHKHQERFSTPYRAGNIRGQNTQIKNYYEQYGKEETKEFIDLCFKHYKDYHGYNSLNFFYMIGKMHYLMGKAQKIVEHKRKVENYKHRQQVREIVEDKQKDKVADILKYWGIEQ